MRIHVGCSGWFYSRWRGIFDPRQELTTRNWFGYYPNIFGTVELNAPFHRWPKPATIRRWKHDAPATVATGASDRDPFAGGTGASTGRDLISSRPK